MGKFFVTIRTVDDRYLLGKVAEDVRWLYPKKYLTYRGMCVEQSIAYMKKRNRLDAWTIMPNHVHLLITVIRETPQEELREVHRAVRSFMNYTSRKRGKKLWQEPYHTHIVQDKQEYQVICNYIKFNHVVWTADRYYKG